MPLHSIFSTLPQPSSSSKQRGAAGPAQPWVPAAKSAASTDLTEGQQTRAPRRVSSLRKSSATTTSSQELRRRRRSPRHQNARRQHHLLHSNAGGVSTLTYHIYKPEPGIPHPPAAEAADGGEESRGSAASTRWFGRDRPKNAGRPSATVTGGERIRLVLCAQLLTVRSEERRVGKECLL